jgi:hypothetical protein
VTVAVKVLVLVLKWNGEVSVLVGVLVSVKVVDGVTEGLLIIVPVTVAVPV